MNKRRKINFKAPGNQVHFISLGCPRNLVDTEVMLGILLKAGYQASQNIGDADYIVINTCGFLEASRQESLDTIGEVIAEKKPRAKVIVAGCMVQTHAEQIKTIHPQVDYFLGSGDAESILKAVEAKEAGEAISDRQSYLEAGEVPRQISTPRHFAYLKIAEGCRKRCSYCIIPDIKGGLKSKPIDRIVKEFRALRAQGVQEIILIAQDLGDWGKEMGYRKSDGLVEVLQTLLKEEGDFWLRLLYLYPDEITDELITLMKSDERICRYLDMPIQHINNAMLKSMRRATSGDQIRSIIATLRKEIPEIVIRTSLIVGFPGETEEQFEELKAFVQEAALDNVGIFIFSKEEGSHAATLPNQVYEATKEARYDALMQVQMDALEKSQTKWIGKKLPVVVEGYHPDSNLLMRGRHKGQCPDIDGEVILNDTACVDAFGAVYLVEITDCAGYDLVGRAIEKIEEPKVNRLAVLS